MKSFVNESKEKVKEGGIPMMHNHVGPAHHIPPHERKAMMHIEFDEQDWCLLRDACGDEDTAIAVVAKLREAPPEIQILGIQAIHAIHLFNSIKEVM